METTAQNCGVGPLNCAPTDLLRYLTKRRDLFPELSSSGRRTRMLFQGSAGAPECIDYYCCLHFPHLFRPWCSFLVLPSLHLALILLLWFVDHHKSSDWFNTWRWTDSKRDQTSSRLITNPYFLNKNIKSAVFPWTTWMESEYFAVRTAYRRHIWLF